MKYLPNIRWLLLLAACAFNTAHAKEFTATVIAVLDGDTVLVQRGSRGSEPLKVRLAGIDAPEKEQPYGVMSQQSLSNLVLKKPVQIKSQAVDDYGRMIAQLTVNGISVNEEQLRRGMAWEYSNRHSNKTYVALQEEARQAKRGLWSLASATPPWEWRKAHATSSHASKTTPELACGAKRHCAQMRTCEEARFYFSHCRFKTLDQDGDGVPCESLCAPKK